MKNLFFIIAAALFFTACNTSSDNNKAPNKDSIPTAADTSGIGSDPGVTIFKVTEEEALKMVAKIPEIDKELKRTFPDASVHNALTAVQPATPEDPNHYIQLMEMHTENGVALAHFRVDAETGEIRVMDPLSEGETWITLDKWRKLKI